ncbi:MAG: WecB/TagA/CpsF family glycosyltransferase, partial [Succinivibrionaceae bacterium]|nr:WecB/TagA/CpsF family glycosyltransferase [Succinivibrionaceae bacterium]
MTSLPSRRTDGQVFVLVGGTSVLGRALLQRIIYISGGRGTAVLAGRKSPGLRTAAEELAQSFPGLSVRAVSGGVGSTAEIQALSERILAAGAPDFFIMALGSPADEKAAEDDPRVLGEKLWVNASAPVIFLEIFFRRMREAGGGRMALFGSVAGDRIR